MQSQQTSKKPAEKSQKQAQVTPRQHDAQATSGNRSPTAGLGDNSQVQGEGDYESDRRYTESVQDFVESGKVDAAARDARPATQQEAQDMRRAEQEGASHAKSGPSPSDRKSGPQG